MTDIEIIKGLPLPPARQRYPFDTLRHGDAFDAPNHRNVREAFYRWRSRRGYSHLQLRVAPGGGRDGLDRFFLVDRKARSSRAAEEI